MIGVLWGIVIEAVSACKIVDNFTLGILGTIGVAAISICATVKFNEPIKVLLRTALGYIIGVILTAIIFSLFS